MGRSPAERSERERVERALVAAEEQLRSLFEQASDGILISDLDARFTDANAAVCAMFGYSRERLLAMTIMDLIEPEEVPRLQREREAMLRGGAPLVSEWWVRRGDGERVLVEVSAKILPDGRWQAFFRDVSARRRADEERERSLRQLRTVLEQIPIGIAILTGRPGEWRRELNERGKSLFHSPLAATDPFGKVASRLRRADGDPVEIQDLPALRALHGERVEPIELAIERPDGSRLPISVRAAPLLAPDGTVEGAVVAFEDISAEKDLDRLRAEWNSVIAHDLRQPLNTIQLYTQLLVRLSRGNPEMGEAIAQIDATTKRLNRMIQDLLDLSRLEARQLSLQKRACDLLDVVRACLARLSMAAPDRFIDLRVRGELPLVAIDPDRVEQALDNLLSNAVKYGAEGTPIEVALERVDAEVVVDVINHGKGLPPDFLPHLFQRFQRASDGQIGAAKGIGLGLYITRELVEAHGGNIVASSDREGRTTFRFTLPVA